MATVLDQHRLAGQHDHHLVLAFVPMALRGDAAGLQHDVAHAEILDPRRRREAAIMALGHGRVKGRRIAGAAGAFGRVEVELRHDHPRFAIPLPFGLSLSKPSLSLGT